MKPKIWATIQWKRLRLDENVASTSQSDGRRRADSNAIEKPATKKKTKTGTRSPATPSKQMNGTCAPSKGPSAMDTFRASDADLHHQLQVKASASKPAPKPQAQLQPPQNSQVDLPIPSTSRSSGHSNTHPAPKKKRARNEDNDEEEYDSGGNQAPRRKRPPKDEEDEDEDEDEDDEEVYPVPQWLDDKRVDNHRSDPNNNEDLYTDNEDNAGAHKNDGDAKATPEDEHGWGSEGDTGS
ncbi:hypothetical protein QCA50_016677 [Cerrena zonata]|uniref:Uncharacterized protein n=1 Tax=Cerrena zonata TaxID=2478898 RepID=A0AAW0FEP8_9APHY